MIAKHTPGPWTYEVEKVSGPSLSTKTYLFAHGDVIGQAYESANDGNAQANARLIAAAPELLELLKEINEALYCDDFGRWRLLNNFDANQLDEVIAKATGDAA